MGKSLSGKLAALITLLLACFAAPAHAQDDRDVAQGSEPYIYEVESLDNGGPPGALDLDTPMGLMESFMAAGAAGDWASASAALDYANVEAATDPATRRELAARLYDLLHRSLALDWSSLPDRPDAVDTQTSSEDPMAGVARRSITIGHLSLENRLIPIRIARLQPPQGEPVWVFSRQTVHNVPALYERFGPTRFEEMLPDVLRKQAFWTLAWWEIVALPIILLIGALAAALTYMALGRWSRRTQEGSKGHGVLNAVQLPATLLAFAGTFAAIRATFFRLTGPVRDILDPLQIILIISAILLIVLAIIEALFEFATDRRTDQLEDPANNEDRDFYTKLSAVRRIVTALLVLGALGFVLVSSDLSSTLGFSIIASAGLIGLVLVFAARKALGDIMASVQIAFARTARIGDAVQFEGQWCYVERIGFTHLRLRTWDERRVIAPVSAFTNESFENWTKQDPSLMVHVELELDNRADVEGLRGPFREFIESDEDVIDPDDAVCQVIDQKAKAMNVRFMARAKNPKTGWKMQCRLREHLLAAASRLDAVGDREPNPAYFTREREVRVDSEESS